MKSFYIQVAENEVDEPVEVPIEDDGYLEVETLAAQFPGACGLKYRGETGLFRGLKVVQGKIQPPEEVWSNNVYIVVFEKGDKRKYDDSNGSSNRIKKPRKCSDLIALGLPFKSTDEDIRAYFSDFGELVMVEVKKDKHTGQSRGFGFIRFSDYAAQKKCLAERHQLEGKWFDVKMSNAKDGDGKTLNDKVFVGRMTENITNEDLHSFFSDHGDITDVFIPRPFRGFAFVTFADPYDAQSVCDENFVIKGTSVHVVMATPRPDNPKNASSEREHRGHPRSNNESSNLEMSQFNPSMMAAFGQALMSTMSSMKSAPHESFKPEPSFSRKPKFNQSYRHF